MLSLGLVVIWHVLALISYTDPICTVLELYAKKKKALNDSFVKKRSGHLLDLNMFSVRVSENILSERSSGFPFELFSLLSHKPQTAGNLFSAVLILIS